MVFSIVLAGIGVSVVTDLLEQLTKITKKKCKKISKISHDVVWGLKLSVSQILYKFPDITEMFSKFCQGFAISSSAGVNDQLDASDNKQLNNEELWKTNNIIVLTRN